jgi:uncharacterized membrane protein YbhN (UPF0104 family)
MLSFYTADGVFVMSNQEEFHRAKARFSKDAWSWIAGTVIVTLLLANAIVLADRIAGRHLNHVVATLGIPTGGLNVDAPPTRTR